MSAELPARFADVEAAIRARGVEWEIDPSLDRMQALMDLLGSPQRSYAVIHVTGTNGKTSTASMIDVLLRARGLRTGRYTSPHLTSMRERICVDGEPLSEERFVAAYAEVLPYVQLADSRGGPPLSFFEVLTAMAFAVFADAPVDVAVVEVGMGGTWDATNVADGSVAVVTPISMDHTRYLGDTIELIAAEKAGIIKPGAVAVLAQQPVDAAEVLLRRASETGASVAREGIEFGVLQRDVALGGQRLVLRGLRGVYDDLFLPLFGEHQASNAACALAAVEAFAGVPGGGAQPLDGLHPVGDIGWRARRAARARGVRPDDLARPPRGGQAQPDRACRRGAQPCGDGGDGGRGGGVVRVRAAGRRGRGQRGQGRARHPRATRAGARRGRGDP